MTPLERDAAHAVARLDRRGFLRVVALAAAGGVVPAGCGSTAPPWLAPADGAALQSLSPRAYATLTAACARIAGPAIAAEIVAGRLRPGATADVWLSRTPALAAPLGQALTLLELGIRPLVAKWRPFTALDGEGQDAALVDLRDSRFALKRAVFAGVRSVSLLATYLTPAAYPLISYPPPFGGSTVSIADAMAPLPD